MKLVLKNKKVAIIAGVSAAVLVTALGVGLGVGLNNSSSSDDYIADANHYATYNGVGVSGTDIENKKVTIEGNEYSIRKRGADFYFEVPSFSGKIQPTVRIKDILSTFSGKDFFDSNPVKGEGKDNFYDVNFIFPSLSIGTIRIPNDGKVYGGFVESTKENVDYEVNQKLKKVFPNGYEIGSFTEPSIGGIEMAKLEKLNTLLATSRNLNSMADVEAVLQNVPTKTKFGFFYYTFNSQEIITFATNKKARKPSELGYVPTVFDAPVSLSNEDYDIYVTRAVSETSHAQRDYEFDIAGFEGANNILRTLTLKKGDRDLSDQIYDVDLNNWFIPLEYGPQSFTHPILGLLKPNLYGAFEFDDSITTTNGEAPDVKLNPDSTFTMPSLLLKLNPSTFNDAEYATTATARKSDELLVNVEPNWLDYFKTVANDQRVKDLAKEMGITIRFKESNILDEKFNIKNKGVNHLEVSEVFFTHSDWLNDKDDDVWVKREQFAPLLEDGILKANLDNPTYFEDTYRANASIFTGSDIDKYGLYPFSRKTKVIAYNSDYLPNGLDFSGDKKIADYLYQEDLGSSAAVQRLQSENTITDEQKNGLLVHAALSTGGTVWAFDYYADTKKDQQPNQQDVAWKKVTRGSSDTSDPADIDYWSVFADPNLKDDERFQKWINHNYHSNSERLGDLGTDESYDKYALFNGHIGAIMIDSSWVDNDWKSGTWRAEGTDEEKQAFAQQKIKFQAVPTGIATGLYGSMISTLKKDHEKQMVAEMFLNVLTDPSKALEVYHATSKLSARKDVNPNGDAFEATSNLFSAVADTHTVFGAKDDEWWPISVFKQVSIQVKNWDIDSSTFYQDIANTFKSTSNNEPGPGFQEVFAPEDPDVTGS